MAGAGEANRDRDKQLGMEVIYLMKLEDMRRLAFCHHGGHLGNQIPSCFS